MLAWLGRHGFRTPSGFIVTTSAFRDYLQSAGIVTLAQPGDWTRGHLERARERVLATEPPREIWRAVGRAYRRLGGAVAVRSSLLREDSNATSFAGQLESVLNVQGEPAVLEAVKRCWASVFCSRVASYFERHGMQRGVTPTQLSLAIVVQRMVRAESAGVAFSADPLTGQNCVVVEATRGLGDALVQGRVEPVRYVVGARGEITGPAAPDQPELPLDHAQVICLAEIVRDIASHCRIPQDVEWAWDGTHFHVLQSRPITTLVGRNVYSSKLVSDMSPGLIAPLVWSTKTIGITRNVFARAFGELLGPVDVDYTHLVKRIHSRLYTNMTLLGELFERLGLPGNFAQMMARSEQPMRHHPSIGLRTVGALQRLGRFAWRHGRINREIEAFIEQHSQRLEAYRSADWSAREPQELLDRVDHLLRLHAQTQWYVVLGPVNMMIRYRVLSNWVRKHVPQVDPGDLIRGLVGLKGLGVNLALHRLGAQAKTLGNAILPMLTTGSDEYIHSQLGTSAEGRALMQSMDAFLRSYGFLSANGSDFTAKPWVEEPSFVWHAIARAASAPAHLSPDRASVARKNAQSCVLSRANRLQRIALRRLLESTRIYIDLRERTSLLMSEDSYQMRRLFLALGDSLATSGKLEDREDVFYLLYDELWHLVKGQLGEEQAHQLVALRRADMAADARVEPPDTVCGEHVVRAPAREEAGCRYLVGIGSSAGIVQGYARVVHDPVAAPTDLGYHDILVVPFTDVSWTPLFPGLGGIIAETGGQLSHTSIVAREYGMPAVVSVRRATRLIRDGQALTVDGTRGRVYLRHVMDS
jgi:phosphohistidine swiveling domain-containing protein